jgi:hypothetical protein
VYARAWINALQVAQRQLPLALDAKVGPEFSSGVLLCALLERADPRVRIDGVNQRARAHAACVANIEKALQVIWKSRVRPAKIPNAAEVRARPCVGAAICVSFHSRVDLLTPHFVAPAPRLAFTLTDAEQRAACGAVLTDF